MWSFAFEGGRWPSESLETFGFRYCRFCAPQLRRRFASPARADQPHAALDAVARLLPCGEMPFEHFLNVDPIAHDVKRRTLNLSTILIELSRADYTIFGRVIRFNSLTWLSTVRPITELDSSARPDEL